MRRTHYEDGGGMRVYLRGHDVFGERLLRRSSGSGPSGVKGSKIGLRVTGFACEGCVRGTAGDAGADGWDSGELIGDEPGVRARAAAKPGFEATFECADEDEAGGFEVKDVNGCAANGLKDSRAAWVVMFAGCVIAGGSSRRRVCGVDGER
jgi:hypothetical protein